MGLEGSHLEFRDFRLRFRGLRGVHFKSGSLKNAGCVVLLLPIGTLVVPFEEKLIGF